jgi:putative addiction module component (TIGR02574 family)
MNILDILEINKLTTSEKIHLVEDLWDRIADENSDIPVPQSHKEELDLRMNRHKSNPDALLSLKELRDRIERRK